MAVAQSSGGAPGADVPLGAGGAPIVDCECVAEEIGWWREGGGIETRRESHLAPCNVFGYGEGPVDSNVVPQCRSALEGCSDVFGVDDINAALAHPDVRQALERAPVLFGSDPRLIGGQLDHIEVSGRVIEIGNECPVRSDCEIPRGVYAFGFLLGTLQTQEVSGGSCQQVTAP
jgi:hypothetical protein